MTDFSTNITDLRKKKGISQKVAAKELGISQALLSHYENGIRECGLEFVLKVANYYQVTCDFLLGNSNSSVSLNSMEKIKDIPEDVNLSTDTVFRASALIGLKYIDSKTNTEKSNKIYAIRNYLMIAKGVENGLIPNSWLGDIVPSSMQLKFLEMLAYSYLTEIKKSSKSFKSQYVPSCIKTITTSVNLMLNESLAELIV